eukprot:CAMPEP_0206258324 /NCGR_PEP_ID=MMETSP0047_2-20121206/25853_1 /ASSEMBLY_ACC=CAM_ASM_000192 /TAXON_ID=195065 /ORGANISM="Chroomonas mesostigmatica_cf, Strain CCMP1168" /LENGTH=316 /DNA_ID=CAMNT_0053685049 /DNA_START=88 /DNA_END=1035 /DNA_ORIENTATION=+
MPPPHRRGGSPLTLPTTALILMCVGGGRALGPHGGLATARTGARLAHRAPSALHLRGGLDLGGLLGVCAPSQKAAAPAEKVAAAPGDKSFVVPDRSQLWEAEAKMPHVIFILGGPGAGKGTQCSKLTAEFTRAKHLSAGDLLREERKKGSAQGKMIEDFIRDGKIVPVEVTAKLLQEAILKERHKYDMFLVDGFPRNMNNLKGWDRICGRSICVEMMLMFECTEKVMTKRLLNRGKTSGRVDDNMDTIRKRLRTYIQETMQVVKHFEKMGKLQRIDADRERDQVYAEVRKVMEPIMKRRLPVCVCVCASVCECVRV